MKVDYFTQQEQDLFDAAEEAVMEISIIMDRLLDRAEERMNDETEYHKIHS